MKYRTRLILFFMVHFCSSPRHGILSLQTQQFSLIHFAAMTLCIMMLLLHAVALLLPVFFENDPRNLLKQLGSNVKLKLIHSHNFKNYKKSIKPTPIQSYNQNH